MQTAFLIYSTLGLGLLLDLAIARRRLAREVAGLRDVQRDVQRQMIQVTGAGPWRSTQIRHAAAPGVV